MLHSAKNEGDNGKIERIIERMTVADIYMFLWLFDTPLSRQS
jgi:hypothetical protein